MRVYTVRVFRRWATKEGMTDARLCAAVREIEAGMIDAALGGELVKMRIAAPGRGKSGSYRTVIAWRRGERAVFLFGFAKNERSSINDKELATFKRTGAAMLALDAAGIETALGRGTLTEVNCDEPNSARNA